MWLHKAVSCHGHLRAANCCRLQVSKGHSLLADLLRTSSLLPPALRPQAINDDRYAAVLFDYRYFKDREALERKIEASPELTQLDEHFREARNLPVKNSLHQL